jgi:GAF domain-containing protein
MSSFDLPGRPLDLARDLHELLLRASGVEEFLAEVAQRACETVNEVLSCGVSAQPTPRSRRMGASSDDLARRIDEIQYDVDDGPALTAMREGVVVVVEDIATDGRWPAYSRRGRAEGAGASLTVPLRVQGASIGALNLYAEQPRVFDEDDHARARRFAEHAAGAVALAIRLAEREEHSRNLEAALTSRTTIDQALGILMGQRRIPASEAFEVLRRLSQRTNVKLRDVAAALIADVTGDAPTEEAPGDRRPWNRGVL